MNKPYILFLSCVVLFSPHAFFPMDQYQLQLAVAQNVSSVPVMPYVPGMCYALKNDTFGIHDTEDRGQGDFFICPAVEKQPVLQAQDIEVEWKQLIADHVSRKDRRKGTLSQDFMEKAAQFCSRFYALMQDDLSKNDLHKTSKKRGVVENLTKVCQSMFILSVALAYSDSQKFQEVAKKHPKLTDILLAMRFEDVSDFSWDDVKQKPLLFLASRSHLLSKKEFELLLQALIEERVDFMQINERHENMLHILAKYNPLALIWAISFLQKDYKETIKVLLHQKDCISYEKNTPLLNLVKYNEVDKVFKVVFEAMINMDPDIIIQEDYNKRTVFWFLAKENPKLLLWVIDICSNSPRLGQALGQKANWIGFQTPFQIFLKYDKDSNDSNEMSDDYKISEEDFVSICRKLEIAGIDLSNSSIDGNQGRSGVSGGNMFHELASHNPRFIRKAITLFSKEQVKKLLNQRNGWNCTPFMYFIWQIEDLPLSEFKDIMAAMVDAGADITQRDENGRALFEGLNEERPEKADKVRDLLSDLFDAETLVAAGFEKKNEIQKEEESSSMFSRLVSLIL